MKRLFDLILAIIFILIYIPLLPFILLVIIGGDRKPIIQRVPLVGKNGKIFNYFLFNIRFPFENMTDNKQTNPATNHFKFIEKISLYLKIYLWPTFFNVLKGDLSFIGPSPEASNVVVTYKEEFQSVLKVRSGILGPGFFCDARSLGQPILCCEKNLSSYLSKIIPQKLQKELSYVNDKRFFRDFVLLAKLIVFKFRNLIVQNVKDGLKSYNILIPIDIFLIFLSYFIAYHLRYEWVLTNNEYKVFLITMPIVLFARMIVMDRYGMYKNIWKYVGIRDLIKIIKAVSVSSVIIVALLFLFRITGHSRSIFFIDWMFCISFLGGARVFFRLSNESINLDNKYRKNILIIGAGDVGEMLLRELDRTSRDKYNVIGFIDDDKNKHGKTLHGIKIFGGREMIPQIAELFRVDEAFIAIALISSGEIKSIINYCKRANIRHKIVPAVSDSLDGTLHLSSIRNVEITDLFGRKPVKLDLSAIRGILENKRVLVTGAGGSIGSELCRQIAKFNPEQLILVDKNENYLHEIRIELDCSLSNKKLFPVLSDVTDVQKQGIIFHHFKPDIVFHAAAQKHVPLSEENPDEALKTNIKGTQVVANFTAEIEASHFVLISTDKAVNPTSIMGVSKRIAELYVQYMCEQSSSKFMTVRFGNVLNSNGSVLPTFLKQIEQGGPVTVTHPEIERYFMSIDEAVQLILQSVTMGENGQIFILDMGNPYKIYAIAEELIRLMGFKPHEDIEIKITGIRPGEKLFEELVGKEEKVIPTAHSSIKTMQRNSKSNLNNLDEEIELLFSCLKEFNFDSMFTHLKKIIPEYNPNSHDVNQLYQNKYTEFLSSKKI